MKCTWVTYPRSVLLKETLKGVFFILNFYAQAIELLSNMTTQNPTSAGTCETAILNICTLYELRYDPATEKKIEIMKQVARWVGDSFQAECIKLQ